jgi:hypothetical protein
MTVNELIARSRKVLDAATPGNWRDVVMRDVLTFDDIKDYLNKTVRAGKKGAFLFVLGEKDDGPTDICHTGNGPDSKENAAAIVQAHNDMPALLACLERAVSGLSHIGRTYAGGASYTAITALEDLNRLAEGQPPNAD